MRSFFRLSLVVAGIVIMLQLAVLSVPAGSATCPEADVAVKAGEALMAAAKTGSAKEFANALTRNADMNAIATFGLGQYRKALPASKSAEFTRTVTSFISTTFNDYRLKFRAESIDFKDCKADQIHTQMFFLGGKGYQLVIWRVKGNKIVDVNVQNIWLGQLLRDYIDSEMNKANGDIEKVIAEMSK